MVEVVEKIVGGGGVLHIYEGIEGGLLLGAGLRQNAPGGVEGSALAAVVEPLFISDIVAVEGIRAVLHGPGPHVQEVVVLIGAHVGRTHADQLGAIQSQRPGSLGELPVIADQNPHAAEGGVKGPEAGAWREHLLLPAKEVGFGLEPGGGTVPVDHDHGVVGLAAGVCQGHAHDHPQGKGFGFLAQDGEGGAVGVGLCQLCQLVPDEIAGEEHLGEENQGRAPGGGGLHGAQGPVQVALLVIGQGGGLDDAGGKGGHKSISFQVVWVEKRRAGDAARLLVETEISR